MEPLLKLYKQEVQVRRYCKYGNIVHNKDNVAGKES